MRGEFRRDWSNEPFFTGRLGAGDLRDHQNTALLGGVVGDRQQAGSVVTAMLDLVFIALSVLFFVAGAAYVAAAGGSQ